jgi:hypothetical protein
MVSMSLLAQSPHCSQYDAVIMSTYADSASSTPVLRAVPVTTTNAAALGYNMVGFAQTAIASSYYGWIGINGVLQVQLVGCLPT